jgi:hypothetical protein
VRKSFLTNQLLHETTKQLQKLEGARRRRRIGIGPYSSKANYHSKSTENGSTK